VLGSGYYNGYDDGGYYGGDDTPYAYVGNQGLTDDDSDCAQRYRSYDPATGTYLGYDGQRHPCQ
jgi:hypothetical protein